MILDITSETEIRGCSTLICFFISEPPSFIDELTSVEVCKGSTAAFNCKVAGSSPLKYTWFKERTLIKSNHKCVTVENQGSLKIQDCSVEDVGSYQCTAANEVGSCTGSAALSLKGLFYR